MITLLVRPELLAQGRGEIEGDAYRHLFRARRLAVGATIRVVDGRGAARWAEIDEVESRRASLALGEHAPANEPAYRLRLAVAALRPERASWLVEKATELGVASIRFISTRRTPRTYGRTSLARWRRVAAAALQQSHGALLPEISGVDPWEVLTASLPGDVTPAEDRFYLDTAPGGAAEWGPSSSSGIVLVGPEGGWSREETQELDRLGCRSVSLGARTLRVETAAIAAAVRLLLR